MSDLSTSKTTHFSSLVISDLILLFSFILSQPLYFCYFIFFSPYILKLVSFLSPVFITTFLVLLALVNELGGYGSVLERLRPKKDCKDDDAEFEDLGIYEMLFGSSLMEISESPVEFLEEKVKPEEEEEDHFEDFSSDQEDLEEEKVPEEKIVMEERRLDNFLKILDEFEKMASNSVEKTKVVKFDKVNEKPTIGSLMRNGSEANIGNKITCGKKQIHTVKAHSQRIISSPIHDDDDDDDTESTLTVESSTAFDCNNNLGSYGSMRKEKEWKRTLACKLFEERHNVDGGEGMDSLWEAYEKDSNKGKNVVENNDKKVKKKKKMTVEEEHGNGNGNENEDEDEVINGQLCCLQALKLSTGKMNLGVGRPNLVKISKAIKGFGWLHSVSKHSKKVHNNNRDR